MGHSVSTDLSHAPPALATSRAGRYEYTHPLDWRGQHMSSSRTDKIQFSSRHRKPVLQE